jgi:hypothetical protein
MNPDSQDFDSLRRLLALKRHEQPPPGYFDRLPREVMARIKAGEKGGETGFDASWLQRLLGMFDVKPVFAGAFGAAVCAMVISGVISEQGVSVVNDPGSPGTHTIAATPVSPTPAVSPVEVSYPSSTNGIAAQGPSLFDQFAPRIERASERIYVTPQN